MANITLPIKISFQEWVYCLINDAPSELIIPMPGDTSAWGSWVESLIGSNPTAAYIPQPLFIGETDPEQWRIWANYFIGNYESSTF